MHMWGSPRIPQASLVGGNAVQHVQGYGFESLLSGLFSCSPHVAIFVGYSILLPQSKDMQLGKLASIIGHELCVSAVVAWPPIQGVPQCPCLFL